MEEVEHLGRAQRLSLRAGHGGWPVEGEAEVVHLPSSSVHVVVTTQKEAEGYKLFLSSKSESGYLNVFKQLNGRFNAHHRHSVRKEQVSLGTYDTAVEAAVAYAKHAAEL